MPQLSVPEYRRIFLLEASRLAAVDPSHLEAEVPHLDDWSIRTVIEHMSNVLQFASCAMVADLDQLPSRSEVPTAPAGVGLLEWFQSSVELATQTMDDLDLTKTVPTWSGPQPAPWYGRRLAHEISIHRWDVQAAIAEPDSIDADLAVDGIDELLEIVAPDRIDYELLAAAGQTLHLHATDHDEGEWLVAFEQDNFVWEHSHTKADVAARGPASALFLMMWGRKPPSELEVFGDETLLARWKAAASL